MIPIKIQCACGQRYAFDVEPVAGRMPSKVACPACGSDGTSQANDIIAQSAPPPTPGIRLSTPSAPAPAAPSPAETLAARLASASKTSRSASREEKWKWWYFVLAGICIGGYSIWQAYDQHRIKPLGELFLAVFCIAIGIWEFQRKRKKG